MTVSEAELSCRQLVELATDYLEGALSRADRLRLERHLAACDGCTAYIEQMRAEVDRVFGMYPRCRYGTRLGRSTYQPAHVGRRSTPSEVATLLPGE